MYIHRTRPIGTSHLATLASSRGNPRHVKSTHVAILLIKEKLPIGIVQLWAKEEDFRGANDLLQSLCIPWVEEETGGHPRGPG